MGRREGLERDKREQDMFIADVRARLGTGDGEGLIPRVAL